MYALEKEDWQDILLRASRLRERINLQVWINGVFGTTLYSPAMAGLNKPAFIEVSPDRFIHRDIIFQALNQSVSTGRQVSRQSPTLR